MNFEFPTKSPTALNGFRGRVLTPADCKHLNDEDECAVLISKTCRDVTPDEARDFIEGFCPALDMGLQDFRDSGQVSMLRVEGADTVVAIDAPRAAALGVGHPPTHSPEVRRVACSVDERVPHRFKDNLRRARGAGSPA